MREMSTPIMLKMSVKPLAIKNSSMPNSTPLRVEIRMSSGTRECSAHSRESGNPE